MNIDINSEKLVKADSDTTTLFTSLYYTRKLTRKLQYFVNMMPDGQYLDLHCDNYDHCDAIVIRLDGEVCPVFKNTQCCMNPLLSRFKKIDSSVDMYDLNKSEAHLSTVSLSCRNFDRDHDHDFIPNHSNGSENWLKTSVYSYNKQVMEEYAETEMLSCLQSYIVAAYEF